MARYRKLPVVIDAIQFTGDNDDEIVAFLDAPILSDLDAAVMRQAHYLGARQLGGIARMWLWNSEENQHIGVPDGHWIIRGVQGEIYPCSPDVFDATYEFVE